MTISIGFRTPNQAALARGLLEAATDQVMAKVGLMGGPYGELALPDVKLDAMYRDPGQVATNNPAALPDALIKAYLATLDKLRFDDALASRFLGYWLSEHNNLSIFDSSDDDIDLENDWSVQGKLVLDRRTRSGSFSSMAKQR